jgi:hypothetical protein
VVATTKLYFFVESPIPHFRFYIVSIGSHAVTSRSHAASSAYGRDTRLLT